MVWGAAASSLRAASEVIIFITTIEFYRGSVVQVVSLHSCLGIYTITTLAIYFNLCKLAMVFMAPQHFTTSLAIDRYGHGSSEENDQDFGEIRLPDSIID